MSAPVSSSHPAQSAQRPTQGCCVIKDPGHTHTTHLSPCARAPLQEGPNDDRRQQSGRKYTRTRHHQPLLQAIDQDLAALCSSQLPRALRSFSSARAAHNPSVSQSLTSALVSVAYICLTFLLALSFLATALRLLQVCWPVRDVSTESNQDNIHMHIHTHTPATLPPSLSFPSRRSGAGAPRPLRAGKRHHVSDAIRHRCRPSTTASAKAQRQRWTRPYADHDTYRPCASSLRQQPLSCAAPPGCAGGPTRPSTRADQLITISHHPNPSVRSHPLSQHMHAQRRSSHTCAAYMHNSTSASMRRRSSCSTSPLLLPLAGFWMSVRSFELVMMVTRPSSLTGEARMSHRSASACERENSHVHWLAHHTRQLAEHHVRFRLRGPDTGTVIELPPMEPTLDASGLQRPAQHVTGCTLACVVQAFTYRVDIDELLIKGSMALSELEPNDDTDTPVRRKQVTIMTCIVCRQNTHTR